MIEKVAEAIWNTNDDPMGQAKAAIKAMRDPTEKMMDSAWDCDKGIENGTCYHPEDTYQAMIDAALKKM